MTGGLARRFSVVARVGRSMQRAPSQRRLSPVDEGDAPPKRCCYPFAATRVHHQGDEWWVQRLDALLGGLAADLRCLFPRPWVLYRGRRGPLIRYELCQYAAGECLVRLARVTCVHTTAAERDRLMALRRLAIRSPPVMWRVRPAPLRPPSPSPAGADSVVIGMCCEGLGPENLHDDISVHTIPAQALETESGMVRAIITGMCFAKDG